MYTAVSSSFIFMPAIILQRDEPKSDPTLKIKRITMPDNKAEIERLRARFEAHLATYREDTMEANERDIRLQLTHEQNMEAIAALTEATKGVVDAWSAAKQLQKFVKWLSSFAIVGGFLIWASSKLPPDLFKGA